MKRIQRGQVPIQFTCLVKGCNPNANTGGWGGGIYAAGEALVGTGTDAAGYKEAGGTATLDLLGNPRRTGRRVDIGCLEAKGPGSALILR